MCPHFQFEPTMERRGGYSKGHLYAPRVIFHTNFVGELDEDRAIAIRRTDAAICNADHLRLHFRGRCSHLPATKSVTVTNGFDNTGGKVEIASRTSPERMIVRAESAGPTRFARR